MSFVICIFLEYFSLHIHRLAAVSASNSFLHNLCHCLHTIQRPLEANDRTKPSRQPIDVSMPLVPTKASRRELVDVFIHWKGKLRLNSLFLDGWISFLLDGDPPH